ncbi:MAG: class I SAM-dependent methyltransferase, partial [Chloroflexi bacterium]|nr:class I SAM-dependent methyltransferase [Chloroflexota bacterium]
KRRDLGISNAFITQGDFHNVPLGSNFHLIYSIEAFIHAQEPDRYLREATRLLAPKGRLILLDDFLVSNVDRSQAWVKYYQDGWYVPNPQTVEVVIGYARDLGFVLLESRDLTPFLRLRALPQGLAGMLYWFGKRLPQDHPIVPSMLGSMALQQCLKGGWIKYHWLVFEKP